MVDTININMLLAGDDSISGAWLNRGDITDVHVTVSNDFGVVIGHNKSYKDDIHGSDIAVSIKDGVVTLQFVNKDNKLEHREISADLLFAKILELLIQLKQQYEI